jgi:hypothetical protein
MKGDTNIYQILESSGEWVVTHKMMWDRFPEDRRRIAIEQWQVLTIEGWANVSPNESSEYDETGSETRSILKKAI